jgi:AAA15 family ATPase/GTPase
MLKATRFRVQNFRNLDDSGWIPLESVTCFLGRNESGKTALLKALHKFNAANGEQYVPLKDFPRDRYNKEYSDTAWFPVCSVEFELADDVENLMRDVAPDLSNIPHSVVATRYYRHELHLDFDPALPDDDLRPTEALAAIAAFTAGVRRLQAPDAAQEDSTQAMRTALLNWGSNWETRLKAQETLRNPEGVKALNTIKQEANGKSQPLTATLIEKLLQSIESVIEEAQREPLEARLRKVIVENLPVFIYFDDYGVLDSAIYLPRFLEDVKRTPNESRTRTIAAMFKHVNVSPEKITELGREKAATAKHAGQVPTPAAIEGDRKNKEERAIILNSASIDISKRFSTWWRQRRHKIRYHADGDYFRIWISDDRRPEVEIELEERSKGFQWFFSFYLVFLVESEEGHKDAVLLLDEPGLHLHPTAQQELIEFFEVLSEKNPLLYSTHSPFLIDGDHLSRVRPVTEDESGHSTIAVGYWPPDRETIFPLWAAAGYAMMINLFEHKKNLLVEGMTDFYYL